RCDHAVRSAATYMLMKWSKRSARNEWHEEDAGPHRRETPVRDLHHPPRKLGGSRNAVAFQDVVGARKKWGGIEILLHGPRVTGTAPGMPLEVDYTYHGGDHLVMKVLELKPGPVDPQVFEIGKKGWR